MPKILGKDEISTDETEIIIVSNIDDLISVLENHRKKYGNVQVGSVGVGGEELYVSFYSDEEIGVLLIE